MEETKTFDIGEIMKLDKKAQLDTLYAFFDEENRLTSSKAAQVEYLTTMRYIGRYLKPGMKILDIGAGAGEYSIALAKMGHEVHAIEYARPNVEKFQNRIGNLPITLREGDARDLGVFENQSFDMVLLMGPLYHLHETEDRQKALNEAIRVLKPGGYLYIAYIANDMIPLTEWMYRPHFFSEDSYDHDTFQVYPVPFIFLTLDQMRKEINNSELACLHEVASDGVSELLAGYINKLSDYGYQQYLKYHFYCCEKPEHLGKTNHMLFVMKRSL